MRWITVTRSCTIAAAAGLAMLAILIVGAQAVARSTVEHITQSVAEMIAKDWAELLSARMPGLEQILEGRRPPPDADQFARAALESGAPFRFKLFSATGRQRFVSDERWRAREADDTLARHNREALAVVATGKPFFTLRTGDGAMRPDLYSEIYTPIVRDGRIIGVAEVYLDETGHLGILTRELALTAGKIALVLLLAFAAPAAAFWLRSRQLQRTADRLERAERYDDLTGALNRAAMTRITEEKVAEAERDGSWIATLVIDLDRFKELNDAHGHSVGDAVLAQAATRIRRAVCEDAAVARRSGDEFEVCMTFPACEEAVVETAAQSVVDALSRSFRVGDQAIRIAASVGYALGDGAKTSPGALRREADTALAEAKNAGRGRALRYRPSMETERQERRYVIDALRKAIAEDGFELHYQPLFDTDSRRLRGFEALLRLNGADGKPIRPDVFVAIAEQMGLIREIGVWVLREACRAASGWPEPLIIAVNLSPAQFGDGDLAVKTHEILCETGLAPERLELEITENLLISDSEAHTVFTELEELKRLGVSIALDDFGTGYSSLSYLWKFPFDRLKVDKSFMRDLAADHGKSREILSTIIALGHVLDLSITAEGVETEEQAAVLRALRCDVLQGFLLGRPAPREATEALIRSEWGLGDAAAEAGAA